LAVARDKNFQGFGRFETGSSGEYRFRTIKPVPYSGRTAHVHFAIKMNGRAVRYRPGCHTMNED
jgi:protocatechuate 3,4-dioxygenase beta subunit